MNNDREEEIIAQRLAELREMMNDYETPARVKPAVLNAFRSVRARRLAVVYRWGAVAACAALLAGGLYWGWARKVTVAHAPVVAAHPAPPASERIEAATPAPPRRRFAVARHKRLAPRRVSRDVATGFFALPYAAPLTPEDSAQVVRVTLPRSAMRSFGLPVNEERWYERVPADVVLGQDGIARAVRFVKLAQ